MSTGPGSGQNYDPGYGSGFGSGSRPAYGPGYDQGYGRSYGPGSAQNYDPGYGSGFGSGGLPTYGPGYGQGGRPGYAPGYGQYQEPPFAGTDQYQGLHIVRETNQAGYVVTIEQSTQGGSLSVTPRRGGLVVRSRYSSGSDRPGSGFTRQWGSTSRSIQLPRDADLSRMERKEDDGRIILTIPRFQGQQ